MKGSKTLTPCSDDSDTAHECNNGKSPKTLHACIQHKEQPDIRTQFWCDINKEPATKYMCRTLETKYKSDCGRYTEFCVKESETKQLLTPFLDVAEVAARPDHRELSVQGR